MVRQIIFSSLLHLVLLLGIADASAQAILSEQQLQEKMATKRILSIHITDDGITGFELNQFGAPTNKFLVPGSYEKLPDQITALAREHNVQILPSQVTKETDLNRLALIPFVIWLFNVGMLISILVIVIKIKTRVSNIEKLVQKPGRSG